MRVKSEIRNKTDNPKLFRWPTAKGLWIGEEPVVVDGDVESLCESTVIHTRLNNDLAAGLVEVRLSIEESEEYQLEELRIPIASPGDSPDDEVKSSYSSRPSASSYSSYGSYIEPYTPDDEVKSSYSSRPSENSYSSFSSYSNYNSAPYSSSLESEESAGSEESDESEETEERHPYKDVFKPIDPEKQRKKRSEEAISLFGEEPSKGRYDMPAVDFTTGAVRKAVLEDLNGKDTGKNVAKSEAPKKFSPSEYRKNTGPFRPKDGK